MTIIVEDGTKVPGAESLISAEYCTMYHEKRGNFVWSTITENQMEQALRRATDFMRGRYRNRWKGHVASYTQGQDWPRVGVKLAEAHNGLPAYYVPDNVIPDDVKNACAELAFRATQGPLVEDETRQPIRETVGPITVTYAEYAQTQVGYTQVDEMLNAYLTGSGGMSVKLVRV